MAESPRPGKARAPRTFRFTAGARGANFFAARDCTGSSVGFSGSIRAVSMPAFIRDHAVLAALTAAVTMLAVAAFLARAPLPSGPAATLYFVTLPAYHATAVLLVFVLLLPLAAVPGLRLALVPLILLWLLFLAADLVVFRSMHMHIDLAVLDMIHFDFRSIGVPVPVLAVAVAAAAALGWLSLRLWRLSRQSRGRTAAAALAFLGLSVLLFLVNSAISIWANRYDRVEVTAYANYLPAFLPVTSHADGERIAALFPALLPPVQGEAQDAPQGGGLVRYPLAPVACPEGPRPSILVVFIESLQADMLSPAVMPNLDRFAAGATRFDRHIANGSATVPGLFAFFFGVHPSYYGAFRNTARQNPSVLTQTLHDLGYAVRVFSSSYLERFALRSLIFPMVGDADFVHDRSDETVRAAFLDSLRADDSGRPRFDFVFLTATHHPYRYPPAYERFRPLPVVEAGFVLNPRADPVPYKNDYRNSAAYIDAQVGEILDALAAAGRLDDTLVIVTGDHAEEFDENRQGYWGHGSNFTRWQTQVPFVVRFPGGAHAGRTGRTSAHVDAVPTILGDVLGCTTPADRYSTGESLLALPERRALVLSSYAANASWIDGAVIERGTGRSYDWQDLGLPAPDVDREAQRRLVESEARFRLR